jgi:hypothetical protein
MHEIGVGVTCFGRPDALGKPAHQGQIVGKTAQQAHGGVGMQIDQSRQQTCPGRSRVCRGEALRGPRHRQQGDDARPSLDRQRMSGKGDAGGFDRNDPLGRISRSISTAFEPAAEREFMR